MSDICPLAKKESCSVLDTLEKYSNGNLEDIIKDSNFPCGNIEYTNCPRYLEKIKELEELQEY